MRLGFLFFILTATIFGSGYWYEQFDTTCKIPIRYRIGDIDARFGTSAEEIQRIALRSEHIWESALQEELFIYDPSASLPINFVFDERQENAEKEAELREDLDAKEGMTETVAKQYEKLIEQFRPLKKEYEGKIIAYEGALAKHNAEVARWNAMGGAPESVYEDLQKSGESLAEQLQEIEALTSSINRIVDELNKIGAKGNSLVTDYNSVVQKYNEQFSEAREFTQGDYTHQAINIYQFDSEDELVIVLAHEFGHALSLDHVENEKSIMYHTMGAQDSKIGIRTEDMAEFNRICTENNALTTFFRTLFSVLPF